MMYAEQIRFQGVVQGVGFRPLVWSAAHQNRIVGWVKNDAEGVLIEAWGKLEQIDKLVETIIAQLPPLAKIESVQRVELPAMQPAPEYFVIANSDQGTVLTGVTPDAATCPACVAEINDPTQRRYHYPFTNCTHCGPRFSIVTGIPYDRGNTTMNAFDMCSACQREYQNPSDRRFHAQPIACPDCGPRLWLQDRHGKAINRLINFDAITEVAKLLHGGAIVAVKGLGGFQLVCDAHNQQTIARLRQRKHRLHKPLALMDKNCARIARYADINSQERTLLTSPNAPIVLLKKRNDINHTLPDTLAPELPRLGFMLPNTPLHHLLFECLDFPLVVTSGNITDEPQAIDNDDALHRLNKVADYFLTHNRDIANRVDDSVVYSTGSQIRFFRCARGYTPLQLNLPQGFESAHSTLAMGADLKNTFCLLHHGKAIVSQHIGELDNRYTYNDFLNNIELYQRLYHIQPNQIAIDRHPDYLSGLAGRSIAAANGATVQVVQHHHAHIASCLAEHQWPLDGQKVLGIALDGLGYGSDNTLWGGEFLLCDYRSSQRLGRFSDRPLPGGAKAMLEPWRNTFSHLYNSGQWQNLRDQYAADPFFQFMQTQNLAVLSSMLDNDINCPRSSSAGRLFDAVAALLNICRERQGHEGHAASVLQAHAENTQERDVDNYPYHINKRADMLEIEWSAMWGFILYDLAKGAGMDLIAMKFHRTVAHAIVELTLRLTKIAQFDTVAVSGGVLQNDLLMQQLKQGFSNSHLTLLSNHYLPANDANISLGQAVICAAKSVKNCREGDPILD